ncbi:arabinan endo-1,5-alpha-L-arabinosidase [Deinococcus aquaedulcis]|uniref:arabinan endo-1,5-alpha-L-arabinosidase n=1 Tax=Deinococcus aquaedulcis TaxID=2840455 RepID=UPI001C82DF44|nr:arabinan endo-1,5-alpha-L-arabinosidase [Deinococcus aquaedulcis]
MRIHPALLLASSVLLAACAPQRVPDFVAPAASSLTSQSVVPQAGELGAHDPVLFKAGSTYCVMSTGVESSGAPGGILVHRSDGGLGGPWRTLGAIPAPAWAAREYGAKNIWAPEVVYNGQERRYYLYYAVSQFGTRNSAIGVASSTNPCATTTWTDHGPMLRSGSGTSYNAIDPSVHWDSASGWWLAWGSFFSGLKVQRLSSMTTLTGAVTTIASRPGVPNNPVEAPTIFKRGDFYYLLASWDSCCKGLASTYKTVMGRATSITGPYLDQQGVRLDQGGGTVLLNHRANKLGQGGGDVYQEGGTFYFAHHFYDANTGGSPKLDLKALEWNGNWPLSSEATAGYQLSSGAVYRLVNQTSNLCLDVQNGVASPAAQLQQWGCNGQAAQNFRLEAAGDGVYRLRSVLGAQDHCLDVANGGTTPGTDVRLWPCNGLGAQQWMLEDMGGGFHRLVGPQTRLALDNVNGSVNAGTEVRTWTPNGAAAQNWRLERR